MDKRGGGRERGNITIFCQKFLSHSAKKFRRGTLLCFRKFLVSKNVRDKRGGRYHDLPSKVFRLTVPNHLVEELFCVSESFGYRKILCLRGEYHDFRKKICCLTLPKNFVAEPFCVSQNFWYRKNLWIRGRGEGVSRLSVKNFLYHSAEKFRCGAP